MLPVEFHPWIAMAVVLAVFVVLQLRRSVPLDLLFLGGVLTVAIAGILTPAQALSGFANPAVLAIGGLLALTAGLKKCGMLDWIGQKLLGDVESEKIALWRLALALVSSSAFLLNTALVAMMAPVVAKWCRNNQVSPSRLLMPVSYLAILGGVCTLIGTSTTLVINAQLYEAHGEQISRVEALATAGGDPQQLVQQTTLAAALEPMSLFEIGAAGLPCAIIGAIFVVLVGPRLLPNRTDLVHQLDDHRREYIVEVRVQFTCKLIGKSIKDAGLRNLPGLFLIEIDRGGEVITPVSPTEILQAEDRLVFAGVVETIVDLEKIPGLIPAADDFYVNDPKSRRARHLTEVVLSRTSPLIRSTLREANFRERYKAAVVAVHRDGERITTKIGEIRLRSGDTLLLQTNIDFEANWRNSPDFYLVSSVADSAPPTHEKLPIATIIFVGMLVWLIIGSWFGSGQSWTSPAIIVLVAVTGFLLTRCMCMSDARRAIDIQLLVTIACALGLGLALQHSGAAKMVAEAVVSQVGQNPLMLLIVVYVLTTLLTEMITNTAVAALMFPIALNVALSAECSPRPFIMAISLAASLAFITPIGYQTNLMVMGPGGYRPSDFLRLGLPLSFLVGTTAIILIPLIWSF